MRIFLYIAVSAVVVGGIYSLYNPIEKNVLTFSEQNIQNVILIVSDSLSTKQMGMYGYKHPNTTFLDEFFGKRGYVYNNARSNASWTLPSFASFMRSKRPSELYVKDLLDRTDTLPEVLRNNNVELVAFLKEPRLSILESTYLLFNEEETRIYPYEEHITPFEEASLWLHGRVAKNVSSKPFFLFFARHHST